MRNKNDKRTGTDIFGLETSKKMTNHCRLLNLLNPDDILSAQQQICDVGIKFILMNLV